LQRQPRNKVARQPISKNATIAQHCNAAIKRAGSSRGSDTRRRGSKRTERPHSEARCSGLTRRNSNRDHHHGTSRRRGRTTMAQAAESSSSARQSTAPAVRQSAAPGGSYQRSPPLASAGRV